MIAGGRARFRFGTVIRVTLLFALLAAHFLARQQTAKTMSRQAVFYDQSQNYPECYRCSLGLLAGQGFSRIGFPIDHPGALGDSSTPPEANPVIEFIKLERAQISSDEFKTYSKTPQAGPIPANYLDTSRILDVHLTAFIWRMFGISWPVFFTFVSLVSTLCCLLVFLMARQLTGSYGAGILAALLFLALPFENQQAIRSVRDISPLWFATVAFGFFVCLAGNFATRKWNYLTYLGLGAVSLLGVGWRSDAFLVSPVLLVGLVVFVLAKQRHWAPSLVAGCLFASGAAGMYTFIRSLGPPEYVPSGNASHVALYGDASRCNLMGLENSLQIPREDVQTFFNGAWYQHGNHPGTRIPSYQEQVNFLDPQYCVVCREMYRDAMKYHLFQYLRYCPEFYLQASGVFGALSEPGRLQGEDVGLLRQSRLPWALPIYDWCLDYLIAMLPFLHIIGLLTLFWAGRDKIRGAFLLLFSLYYSVIWFAALPEEKHLGQMLLPLAVGGGLGLWGLAKALGFLILRLDFQDISIVIPKHVRIFAWATLGAAVCWALTCVVAYRYSVRHRDHYVNDITELAARAIEAKELIKDSRLFAVALDPRSPSRPKGYILTIQASSKPSLLTCRHVQFPTRGMQGRIFVTHHKLYPGRGQYFAVSCVHSALYGGDIRPYACTVVVPPGCSIVGCRELDLSAWKRLPFSTIFCDGEHLPGSPVVGKFHEGEGPSDPFFASYTCNNLSSEVAYDYPWDLLTAVGLPFDQNFNYPGLAPERLAAVFGLESLGNLQRPTALEEFRQEGLPLELLAAAPGVEVSVRENGVELQISPVPSAVVAEYPLLRVPSSGVYLFKVKYQQLRPGDLILKAVRKDGKGPPKQCCLPQMEGDCPVKLLEVKLNAGDSVQLQMINQLSTDPAGSEFLIQGIQAYRERNPLWEVVDSLED